MTFLLLLAGCGVTPDTDTAPPSEPVDTDAPPMVDDALLLSDLESTDAAVLCEDFEGRTAELTCGGGPVTVFPEALSFCRADLADVRTSCGLTVGDLLDCVDALEAAECSATVDDPLCVGLVDADCGLGDVLSELLGPLGGVLDSTPLNDLDTSDWQELCEEQVDPAEPEIQCDGFTVGPGTVEGCVDSWDTDYVEACTVGQWRACQEYEPVDPCDLSDLGPCETLITECFPQA